MYNIVQSRFAGSTTQTATPTGMRFGATFRTFPKNFKPAATSSGYWRGADLEERAFHIALDGGLKGVEYCLTQGRNLFSPFSGNTKISFAGAPISPEEVAEKIKQKDFFEIHVESETESWTNQEVLEKLVPQQQLRPTGDVLIEWVSDNFAMEGAITTVSEIKAALGDSGSIQSGNLSRARRNSILSAASFCQHMEELNWEQDISRRWLKDAHFGLDEPDSLPGSIRTHQEARILALARKNIKFPVGQELSDRLDQWIEDTTKIKLGAENGLELAHKAQFDFVSIHPFLGGNGRVSRLLWNVLLHRLGYPLSMYPRGSRHVLMQAIHKAHVEGDWDWFYRVSNECSVSKHPAQASTQSLLRCRRGRGLLDQGTLHRSAFVATTSPPPHLPVPPRRSPSTVPLPSNLPFEQSKMEM